MRGKRDDPNQTLIDWSNPAAAVAPCPPSFPDPIALVRQQPEPLVQRLPWDFSTTFPQPTEDAIDAGVLDETDREPENLKSLHENYSRQCLATLEQLDKVMDARRRGVDPGTQQKPRTAASRIRLERYLKEEPERLEHTYRILIETYENAFGVEAAHAFSKFLRATHAGVTLEMVGDARKGAVECASSEGADSSAATPSPARRRAPTVLPVPKPLPEAITRGDFGLEENGKPVHPSPREVRAITEHHTERLIDILGALRDVERLLAGHCSDVARVESEKGKLQTEFRRGVEKYASSFGPEAGERLEAYCRRQVKVQGLVARC